MKVEINTAKILADRGLGGSVKAQKFLASEVARLCDHYVPFQQGHLKDNHIIAPDGSTLTYTQPYAHYQYYGEVMAGRAPKKYTGKAIKNHGANRGRMWDKRMLADKGKDLVQSLDAYIKRG